VSELTGAALERLADSVKREMRAKRKAVEHCILCGRPLPKTARKSSKKNAVRKS